MHCEFKDIEDFQVLEEHLKTHESTHQIITNFFTIMYKANKTEEIYGCISYYNYYKIKFNSLDLCISSN